MTTETSIKKWYVLRAVSGQEKKVKAQIEAEIKRNKLDDYIAQVLIPTEKKLIVRNGKKVSKETNYFPGYIMVEAALVGEVGHTLKNVTGVIGFLSETKGGEPVPLRPAEVNRILGKVDELAERGEEMSVQFTVGESVKVTDGAFNGFSGTIEEIVEDKKKLKVSIKIFGRKSLLELNYVQVEKE